MYVVVGHWQRTYSINTMSADEKKLMNKIRKTNTLRRSRAIIVKWRWK